MLHRQGKILKVSSKFLERPLRLYVYNHEYDVTRPVTITPSRSWGGNGALGCVLGFGALHRVPAPLEEPPNAPGETLFDSPDGTKSSDKPEGLRVGAGPDANAAVPPPQKAQIIVPANIQFDKPVTNPASGPPKDGRKGRSHQHGLPANAMDDYFKEGEEKSKEEDMTPAKSRADALPPPPKGGPPKTGPPPSDAESLG